MRGRPARRYDGTSQHHRWRYAGNSQHPYQALGHRCLAIAVDIALSHWSQAASIAWPLAATPELLQYDEDRFTHDISGISQLMRDGKQNAQGNGGVNLDTRPSRQTRLSDKIGQHVFGKDSAAIDSLRDTLENARQCIRNGAKNEDEDPINGLRATARTCGPHDKRRELGIGKTAPQRWRRD